MALNVQEAANSISSISKNNTDGKHSAPHPKTKRERWAYKEAKSLGVGKLLTSDDLIFNSQQFWDAFVLLYEMLEEYGTHLVEAAWNNQGHITMLVAVLVGFIEINLKNVVRLSIGCPFYGNEAFIMAILKSFLDINWEDYGNYINSVPEDFVLGPFMQGLNDPIHHKEFGLSTVNKVDCKSNLPVFPVKPSSLIRL
ncbi:hypothetical protein PIB30_016406 [Stylosanthes scabra]|uniref:Chlorophyll a-b binding protein, chloroplastic n=1 Tax=Stylosanthes scabra TaxID=79078 RepID=A0ABU6U6G9_9FABA|nr:hypothetical protein [Stylosanthes scabra]